MAYSKLESEVMQSAEKIAERYGYGIYDVEFVKEGPHKYLRVYIFNDDGVDLDDCESVSRELSAVLDEVDIIPDNYFLEVSSPGIERVLRQDWHFSSAIGEPVRLKLYSAVDGSKEYEGELTEADEFAVKVKTDAKEVKVDKKNISKANIIFSF